MYVGHTLVNYLLVYLLTFPFSFLSMSLSQCFQMIFSCFFSGQISNFHFSWSFMCTFEQILILELTKEIAIKWGVLATNLQFSGQNDLVYFGPLGTQTNTYFILGSSQCTKQFNIQISAIFAIQTWPWEMNLKAFISNLNLMSSCNIFCILSPLYSICD